MLKNLLALLLAKFYSKEESGLVARQAMPSDRPVNIASKTTISSWGTIATFTAPGDGYVTFHGRSMNSASAQIASLPLDNNPTVITATQDNYQVMACNLPVQKGKTVEIYGSNIENIVISFNRLIGGGCNRIVRRAQSCLKPSFNYLPKVSSRAKNNGSAVKPSLIQESTLVQQLVGMSLQRMVTSVSSIQVVQEAICFLISTQERIQVRHRQIVVSEIVGCFIPTLTWGPLSLLKKGCQSILRPIQSQSRFGSVRQRVGVNLSAGGALC